MKLEDLQSHVQVEGIRPDGPVTVVGTTWLGSRGVQVIQVTYRIASGGTGS